MPRTLPSSPQSRLPERLSHIKIVAALAAGSLLSACATPQWGDNTTAIPAKRDRTITSDIPKQTNPEADNTRFFETPSLPVEQKATRQAGTKPPPMIDEPGRESTVVFNSIALPQFIDSVFGVILKKTIAIDPQLMQRRDLVSMRTGKAQTPSQLDGAAKAVLRAYGVVVQELPGLTRFVPADADASALPEIRRGRALPEVPESIRPLFYIVELENTASGQAASWLKTAFASKITVTEDNTRNTLMLSGSASNIAAATEALQVLDQPRMRGSISARITPKFWSVDELTKRLLELLTAEGYMSAAQANSPAPIVFLPIAPAGSVIVFSSSQKLLDHALQWAEELDQPAQNSGSNYFTYMVRNADAADIAATLTQVITGVPAGTPGPVAAANAPRVVVNKATNSIIIQASATDYQQWYSLLRELDRPAKNALVSVSIAEITLTESEEFGFDWLLNNLKINNLTGTFGKTSIAPLAASNKTVLQLKSGLTPTVLLNALATTNKLKVLANPSLVTRSGEEATISVGQDVPTVTSTQSNANTSGGTQSTIQYRKTGVLLKVRPVVHNGGRIDLDVNQEVSSALDITAGQVASPKIDTRTLLTKLTVTDGNTVILGGLMRDDRSSGNGGLPYIKDIPLVGPLLFGNVSNKINRTELVMLITAYSIEDDFDSQAVADAFRARLPWTAPLLPAGNATKPTDEALSKAEPSTHLPTYKARPYIPKKPAPAQPAAAIPQDATNQSAPLINPQSIPAATPKPGPTTGNPATTPNPGNIVTDEALKRELMEAIKIKP